MTDHINALRNMALHEDIRSDEYKALQAAISALQREAAGGGEEWTAAEIHTNVNRDESFGERIFYTAPRPTGTEDARKLYEPDDYADAFKGREPETCQRCGKSFLVIHQGIAPIATPTRHQE